jgi:hypothetical protein
MSPRSRVDSAFPIILTVGLIAGTLDIVEDLLFNVLRGITPTMVFKYIASGLIGLNAAAGGGLGVVCLGVALHYVIALIWTAVFYFASRRFSILLRRPVICGLLYGAFVYVFMNWIVLPLSAVPPVHNATVASRVNNILAVLFCIGLAISLLVRRFTRSAEAIL